MESLEGRASQTGSEAHNRTLSIERADAVAQYFLRKGIPADRIGLVTGYGSERPINDRPGGEIDVNRSVMISYALWVDLPENIATKPRPRENGSSNWGIRFKLSGSGSHKGVGGAFAYGELINMANGDKKNFTFQGGGLGVGLQTPGAAAPWSSDFTYFTTDNPYTFEEFDGTLARLDLAGAGLLLIGYGLAVLHLPKLGANAIYVGGWNMGAVGADASSNVGWLNVIGQ